MSKAKFYDWEYASPLLRYELDNTDSAYNKDLSYVSAGTKLTNIALRKIVPTYHAYKLKDLLPTKFSDQVEAYLTKMKNRVGDLVSERNHI